MQNSAKILYRAEVNVKLFILSKIYETDYLNYANIFFI
jgi:hypothetical protein